MIGSHYFSYVMDWIKGSHEPLWVACMPGSDAYIRILAHKLSCLSHLFSLLLPHMHTNFYGYSSLHLCQLFSFTFPNFPHTTQPLSIILTANSLQTHTAISTPLPLATSASHVPFTLHTCLAALFASMFADHVRLRVFLLITVASTGIWLADVQQ